MHCLSYQLHLVVVQAMLIEQAVNDFFHVFDCLHDFFRKQNNCTSLFETEIFKRKKAFESKGLKVNIKKTKVVVSGSKGEILKSKVDQCAKCRRRMMENLVMCTKCCKWVHGRRAKIKRVTSTLAKSFFCELCVYTKELLNQVKYYHFLTRLTL